MTYVAPIMDGLECELCKKQFSFWGSKKTSWWRTDAIFECPRCFKKLVYPPPFRLLGFGMRFSLAVAALICVVINEDYIASLHKWLVVGLMFGILAIFVKSLGLKSRHIVMVEYRE